MSICGCRRSLDPDGPFYTGTVPVRGHSERTVSVYTGTDLELLK